MCETRPLRTQPSIPYPDSSLSTRVSFPGSLINKTAAMSDTTDNDSGPDPIDPSSFLNLPPGQTPPPVRATPRAKRINTPLDPKFKIPSMVMNRQLQANLNAANSTLPVPKKLTATEKSVLFAKAFQGTCPKRSSGSRRNGVLTNFGTDFPAPTPSINAAYDLSAFKSSPLLEKKMKSPGGLPVVHIPETQIVSPLASNLLPQTINDLREMLCGRDPPDGALNKTIPGNENDGWSGGVGWADVVRGRGLNKPDETMWTGPVGDSEDRFEKVTFGKQEDPYADKKARERGEEIWESWKRAWDLWNGNYIVGRVNPIWIRGKYEELKAKMDEKKRRRGMRFSRIFDNNSTTRRGPRNPGGPRRRRRSSSSAGSSGTRTSPNPPQTRAQTQPQSSQVGPGPQQAAALKMAQAKAQGQQQPAPTEPVIEIIGLQPQIQTQKRKRKQKQPQQNAQAPQIGSGPQVVAAAEMARAKAQSPQKPVSTQPVIEIIGFESEAQEQQQAQSPQPGPGPQVALANKMAQDKARSRPIQSVIEVIDLESQAQEQQQAQSPQPGPGPQVALANKMAQDKARSGQPVQTRLQNQIQQQAQDSQANAGQNLAQGQPPVQTQPSAQRQPPVGFGVRQPVQTQQPNETQQQARDRQILAAQKLTQVLQLAQAVIQQDNPISRQTPAQQKTPVPTPAPQRILPPQKSPVQQQPPAQRPLPEFDVSSLSTPPPTTSRSSGRIRGTPSGTRGRTSNRPTRGGSQQLPSTQPLPPSNDATNPAKRKKSVSFAAGQPQTRLIENTTDLDRTVRRTSPRKGADLMPPPPLPKKGGGKMFSPAMMQTDFVEEVIENDDSDPSTQLLEDLQISRTIPMATALEAQNDSFLQSLPVGSEGAGDDGINAEEQLPAANSSPSNTKKLDLEDWEMTSVPSDVEMTSDIRGVTSGDDELVSDGEEIDQTTKDKSPMSKLFQRMRDIADMTDQKVDDLESTASFERSPSPEYPPPLGKPKLESDGSSGGFIPMKELDEYKPPPLEDFNDPDFVWDDVIMNSVWRPRRLGEEKLQIDIDEDIEDFHNNTDLEVDGGVDCGRSPYPVLRSLVNHYTKIDDVDGAVVLESLQDQPPVFPYLKRREWDEVTGTIFNMPTIPETGTEPTDEEKKAKAIHGDFFRDENLAPHAQRHSLFPLDIRRCDRVDPKDIDPETKLPRVKVRAYSRDWPEELQEIELDWENPVKEYNDLDERDPWHVSQDQELLRDTPKRTYPPSPCVHENGQYLYIDETPWREEAERDIESESRYFVTNLHGGTLIINGQVVQHGQVAGPLPAFAVIETEGGQVSFWWGVGGREWGQGPDPSTVRSDVHWATLRRRPGWEYVGLSAGQVWERIILDRLHREQTGEPLADDDLWEEWKNATESDPKKPDLNDVFVNMLGNYVDLKLVMGGHTHDPDEACDDACKQRRLLNRPECFANDEQEIEWLVRKAEPLSRAAEELTDTDTYRSIALPVQDSEDFFEGPGDMPLTKSTEYQDNANVIWDVQNQVILQRQQEFSEDLKSQIRNAELDLQRKVLKNNKRKANANIGRPDPQKRQKVLADDAKAAKDLADKLEADLKRKIRIDKAAKELKLKDEQDAREIANLVRIREPKTSQEMTDLELEYEVEQDIARLTRKRLYDDKQRILRLDGLAPLPPLPALSQATPNAIKNLRKTIAREAQKNQASQPQNVVEPPTASDIRANAAQKRIEDENKRKAAALANTPVLTRKQQETQKRRMEFQGDVQTTKRQKLNQQAIDSLLPSPLPTQTTPQVPITPVNLGPRSVAPPAPPPQINVIPPTGPTQVKSGLPTPGKPPQNLSNSTTGSLGPLKTVPGKNPFAPTKNLTGSRKNPFVIKKTPSAPTNLFAEILKAKIQSLVEAALDRPAGMTDDEFALLQVNRAIEMSELLDALDRSQSAPQGALSQFQTATLNGVEPTQAQIQAAGLKTKDEYLLQMALMASLPSKGMAGAVDVTADGNANSAAPPKTRRQRAREAFRIRLENAKKVRAQEMLDDPNANPPEITVGSQVRLESGGRAKTLREFLDMITNPVGLRAHVTNYVQSMITAATARGVDLLAERGYGTDDSLLFNEAWNLLRAVNPNLDAEEFAAGRLSSWRPMMDALRGFGQWAERVNALPEGGRPLEDYDAFLMNGPGGTPAIEL